MPGQTNEAPDDTYDGIVFFFFFFFFTSLMPANKRDRPLWPGMDGCGDACCVGARRACMDNGVSAPRGGLWVEAHGGV